MVTIMGGLWGDEEHRISPQQLQTALRTSKESEKRFTGTLVGKDLCNSDTRIVRVKLQVGELPDFQLTQEKLHGFQKTLQAHVGQKRKLDMCPASRRRGPFRFEIGKVTSLVTTVRWPRARKRGGARRRIRRRRYTGLIVVHFHIKMCQCWHSLKEIKELTEVILAVIGGEFVEL